MRRATRIHRRPLRAAVLAGLVLAALLATPAAAQDTDPPVIRVLEGGVEISGGALFDGAVTLTIETTDASPPVDVVATLDGAAFTSGGTVSDEGLHQLAVTATDAAGTRPRSTSGSRSTPRRRRSSRCFRRPARSPPPPR